MNTLLVQSIKKRENDYEARIENSVADDALHHIRAGERMLVDSDKLRFIYVLEDETELYYLSFPLHSWDLLNECYNSKKPMYVRLNTDLRVPLKNIHEELSFLIENIKGNSNYGEQMESAVQKVFVV